MMLALLLAAAAAHWPGAGEAEHQIRAQRAALNRAIAKGDLDAIGAVLADNAQIVTGGDSLVFNGKADELRLWREDLAAPSRGIYVRTPDRIALSPVAPVAMETGHYKGVRTNRRRTGRPAPTSPSGAASTANG